jgi:NADPH:quinone reductase-like Zn-dependent oxidoreductase
MRAVQITRFGGPEVLDVVDLPDPMPGDGEQLYEVSSAGINYADTHHRPSWNTCQSRRGERTTSTAGSVARRGSLPGRVRSPLPHASAG